MKFPMLGAACACDLIISKSANAALTDFNIVTVHEVGITEGQYSGLTTIVVTSNKQ